MTTGAHRKLEVWIEGRNPGPARPRFDIYLNDPNVVKDLAKFGY